VEYLTEFTTTIALHRWMTVKATPLTPHPSDPGPAAA
jgi:muconolactone delta-isomerase